MSPLLFLVHRIPYPPNKGDKVRSFHLLEFLASRYAVHLGTFVDDPRDLAYVSCLATYCASFKVIQLSPRLARIKSLAGFWTGESLTQHYYRDASMATWTRATISEQRITGAVVFSSAMAQYVLPIPNLRVVVDFVDVDSEKWHQYGRSRRWPLSFIYKREGTRLHALERTIAKSVSASVFVTHSEAGLFRKLVPESAPRVFHAQNGVDVEFFSPDPCSPSPFANDEQPIVFTGAMDYWPNVDAVCWFTQEILPLIIIRRPRARFYVVGSHPTSVVRELARHRDVVVTGRVPDVRPYLQHACVVVAPMRVARGIQNKVLEAMAMARAVVVSTAAAGAFNFAPGREYEVANTVTDFADKTVALMNPERSVVMGNAARKRVSADYDWTTNLALFEFFMNAKEEDVRTAYERSGIRADS